MGVLVVDAALARSLQAVTKSPFGAGSLSMRYGIFFTLSLVAVGYLACVPMLLTHNRTFGLAAFFLIFWPGIFFAWEITSLLQDGQLFKKGALMQALRGSSLMFKSWALSMLGLIAVSAVLSLLSWAK